MISHKIFQVWKFAVCIFKNSKMEERKKRSGVLFDFIRGAYIPGALGASLACLFTNPIEVVKTRMQLQGELTASGNFVKTYKNPIQAFSVIYHNEGIKGIQKGLGPAVGYQVIMNGFRLGSYGPILKLLNVEHSSSQAELVGKRLIAGASAGAIGAVMGRFSFSLLFFSIYFIF